MQFVMFTKHLEGSDLPQIIDALKWVGVEGADLCVRPGYPVNPENAATALPAAVKLFADAGLSIPMITTPGDFTDPEIDYTESLLAACGESGAKLIKLGYWHMGEEGYWATLDKCRRQLDGLAKLAEKHGVKVCIHNHCGNSMGLNSCAAMNIVKGFDPQHVGVFADIGHLSLVGEPLPMAFDIVKEYLSIVAFKSIEHVRTVSGGKSSWGIWIVPLGDTHADVGLALKLLKEMNFAGPISLHSEYSGVPVATVIDQSRIDRRYVGELLKGLEG